MTAPTDRHRMNFDFNSPEQRLLRYKCEQLRRLSKCAEYFGLFALLDLTIGWILFRADSHWGLCSSLLIVPVMLMGGDAYELVRDCLESKIFCPKYDGASQPKPKFEVGRGLGPYRLLIYFAFAPLPSTALIWLLKNYGQIHLPPDLNLWELGICLSFALAMLGAYGLPISLRATLKPLKRVPSPDIN